MPGVDRRVKAPVRITQPEGHPGPARRQVPGAAGRRPQQLQAPPLQAAAAGQGIHRRRRRDRLRHARRALPHPEQGGEPDLARARTAPGPATWPATSIPGGVPDNPLKARWLGIFDGAGIHGTDETYSLGHAASHGCIRMAIPDVIELYDQVPVGAPDLHRLAAPAARTPISAIGTSSQPCSSRRSCARCVECRACR